jgi:membrane protein DedA with SNARE-associated domain
MGFIEETTLLGEIFGRFGYLAPFTLLLLCGIGFPLPEEVALIGAGLLLYRGEVEFVQVTLVCAAAILLGDSLPYLLGRRFGMRALRIRWVARILHPERFQRFQRRFEEHGNWAIFGCRFVAGIRIPGYFVAGTMGMPYGRFLLLDTLGVVLSVPISIYLGNLFGGQIERLKDTVKDLHLILAFLVLTLVVVMVVKGRRGRAAAQAARAAAEASGETSDEPPKDPTRDAG